MWSKFAKYDRCPRGNSREHWASWYLLQFSSHLEHPHIWSSSWKLFPTWPKMGPMHGKASEKKSVQPIRFFPLVIPKCTWSKKSSQTSANCIFQFIKFVLKASIAGTSKERSRPLDGNGESSKMYAKLWRDLIVCRFYCKIFPNDAYSM